MKLKRFLIAAMCVAASVPAFADAYFRAHRYDSFKATPIESNQIVFAGNSITNMHSWFEAFDSHQEVVGRGNSGGFAYELLDELESYIDGKPAKFFVMIGTNDLSSGETVDITSRRIMAIVKRVRLESPDTEVYVESILPRGWNAKSDYEECNSVVSSLIDDMDDEKVHFVNLSEVCAGVQTSYDWATDLLHPRPKGYAAWCNEIEDLVGYETVYPDASEVDSKNQLSFSSTVSSRVEQFAWFKVNEGDVLLFGDEQIHGGEWHELLRSNKIKDRGLMWGWGGLSLSNAKIAVTTALENQENQPAKIFLSYGIGDIDADADEYIAIVDKAKELAPNAKIYIMSLTPSSNTDTNAARVAFNETLQTVATETSATYVDVYTPLAENVSKNIIYTNYITGRGYVVMANTLATYLTEESVNPVSLDEYDEIYARRTVRKIIGDALTEYYVGLTYGDEPGQIKEKYRESIDAKVAELGELINKEGLTEAEATEAVAIFTEALADYNLPKVSTEDEDHWYVLASNRGNYYLSTVDSRLIGYATEPSRTSGCDVWKFVERTDGKGTYDIVNYLGEYINPVATHNTQMSVSETQPKYGWEISYSDYTTGSYTIYSTGANSQFNQTNSADSSGTGYMVYNWHNASTLPNRTDQGCSYSISVFDGVFVAPDLEQGWYTIEALSTTHSSSSNLAALVSAGTNWFTATSTEYRQNDARYYFVSIEGKSEDRPALQFFNVCQSSGSAGTIQSQNGHYVDSYGTAARASQTVSITTGEDNTYTIPFCAWFSNTVGAPNPVLGRFSGSTTDVEILAADLSEYDTYTVNIVGEVSATLIVDDVKITLNNSANKGLDAVYNGGTFFVTKGTEISVPDIEAPTHNDNDSPVITISEGVITVDYDSVANAISEIETSVDKSANEIYDLTGRRVVSPANGIYIVNGAKVRI